MKRILITGSRNWTDYNTIFGAVWDEIRHAPQQPVTIVHGGARGVDALATTVANFLAMKLEVHPADWKHSGNRAELLRTTHMVNLGANVCLAFIRNNSRGATDCARKAEEAGIPVRYFRQDD